MEEDTRFSESAGVVVMKNIDGCLGVAAGAGSSLGSSDDDGQLEPKAWKLASGTLSNGHEFSDDGAFDGKKLKDDNVYKRKHACFDKANSYMNKRSVRAKLGGNSATEDTIRVQAGNAVLKVSVNSIKKGSGVLKMYDHSEPGLRCTDAVKTIELACPSFYAKPKVFGKAISSVEGERRISELQNLYPTKNDSTSEDTIRVQGKNGVLKVTVNNNKKGSGVLKMYDHSEAGLRSLDTVKTIALARPSFYSEPKVFGKTISSVERERSMPELRNSYPTKNDSTFEDTIRVHGKNGVLKVTVNNKKKGSGVLKMYDHSEVSLRTIELAHPSFYSEKLYPTKNTKAQDWISDDIDTSLRLGTMKLNSNKTSAAKVSKELDLDSDNSDASLKDTLKKREAHKPLKSVRGKEEIIPLSKMISTTSEGKVKRGSGTEKQMLREKIRKMLLDAGWTIDYRPRRNRDYQDSVYINPSGSAYWSIIKAYEAFQKQKQAGELKPGGECSSFSEISDLVLGKLTRRTRKKIEKEMKQKQRDIIGSENKGPVKYKTDTPSRAKTPLNDSNTESESDNNCTRDANCNGDLLKGRKFGRCTSVVRGTNTAENSQADGNIPCTGISLLQCQMDASNKQEESERSGFHSVYVDDDDPNNDTCGICGDGGDLICCDSCPSTFHLPCLGMKILPTGDWICSNCACKFCGMAGSINPDANNITGCDLSTCSLCERKYHKTCIQDVDDLPVDSTSLSFCGKKCRETHLR